MEDGGGEDEVDDGSDVRTFAVEDEADDGSSRGVDGDMLTQEILCYMCWSVCSRESSSTRHPHIVIVLSRPLVFIVHLTSSCLIQLLLRLAYSYIILELARGRVLPLIISKPT